MEVPRSAPPAWIVAAPEAPRVEIWGLRCEERLRRSLGRAGCDRVEFVGGAADGREPGTFPDRGHVLLARADYVYDERLVEALLARPGCVLMAPADGGRAGEAVAAHVPAERAADGLGLLRAGDRAASRPETRGLTLVTPGEIVSGYSSQLRKFEPPFLLRPEADSVRAVEDRLFRAAYKGATDLVTKWAWPGPAAAVTRVLARQQVHPNTVTVVSWLLAILALVWFGSGDFGAGLLAAWAMTFFDTVDGKLARVTLTSSRAGHVMDHGLDLLHPPFWWLAWGLALPPGHEAAVWIVVGGYFVGRALEGVFLLGFDMEMFCWRPIDTLFRTIVARRNPNLILLSVGTLGGRPDLGYVMVAIWTAASCGFQAVRIAQAFAALGRGEGVRAWDEAPHPSPRPTPAAPARGEQAA